LVAGNETTTNLIGNGALLLLNNPDQRQLLQERPDLLVPAVEEMLRYDGTGADDIARDEDGHRLPGARVQDRPGRAGRYRRSQPRPGAVRRAGPLSHRAQPGTQPGVRTRQSIYCIGAGLAMAEAEVAISTLLKRFPAPEATFESPDWGQSFILRGLKSLPLNVRACARLTETHEGGLYQRRIRSLLRRSLGAAVTLPRGRRR